MTPKVLASFLLCVCVMVGCARAPAQPKVGTLIEFIWVEQYFNNGAGGNFTGQEPPDPVVLLSTVGIAPLTVRIQGLPHCMGPGCPTVSVVAFARIEETDLRFARQVGFKESRGPD
jgi:hypothetical protein